jgi:hypothetical protein
MVDATEGNHFTHENFENMLSNYSTQTSHINFNYAP